MRTPPILLLLTCAFSLLAETPNAPVPATDPGPPMVRGAAFVRAESGRLTVPLYRRTAIAGFTLDAAARALDAYSTHRALEQKGTREIMLPNAIARSQPALYGYSASCVVSEYVGSRFLIAHHHERLGRWLPYVDSALVLPVAVHNLTLLHGMAAGGQNPPGITVQAR